MKKLTQKRLKELLHYDPETGIWTWRVNRRRVKAGDKAGCIDTRGYRLIRINNVLYKSSRLVWLYTKGYWPLGEIDHINKATHDDRKSNLRCVTRLENMRNKSVQFKNLSGVTGVTLMANKNKWRVSISVKGNRRCVTNIKILKEAVKIRWEMEKELLGVNHKHTSSAYQWLKERNLI